MLPAVLHRVQRVMSVPESHCTRNQNACLKCPLNNDEFFFFFFFKEEGDDVTVNSRGI